MEIRKKQQPKIIRYKARLLFEVTMGTMFNLVIVKMFFSGDTLTCQSLIFTIGLFVLVSEGIFAFNKLLGYKYSWHQHTLKRLVLLVIFTGFWFVMVSFIAHLTKPLLENNEEIPQTLFWASLVISILFVTIYVSLLIAYNYHQSLAMFIRENETLKNEKLQLDYRALQDQINPHFLFNNLSTLIAIVRQDQKTAIRFAENFSDVYRYVLKSKDDVSVPLREELEFIEAYLNLHKERLGEGLQVILNVEEDVMEKRIPVLSLQSLVENAIKHNVVTLSNPLKIYISTNDDFVSVKNNLNHKNTTYSTNTGLKNLEKRISFLTNQKMRITKKSDEFIVELPLIE